MVYGDNHTLTAAMAVSFARTLAERGKYAEAEATLRQSLKVLVSELPPEHQYTASAEYFLGETLLATNRLSEAERVLISSIDRWKRSGAPTWRTMRSVSALGETLYRQGHLREGENYLSESFNQLSTDRNADAIAKKKARERFERFVKQSSSNQRATMPTKRTVATQ
jgi:tetratricopeptide (TPR) repeat protein